MIILTQQQIHKRIIQKIRQKYDINAEQRLSRFLHGAALGTYAPTADEMQEIADYQAHVESCRQWGIDFAIENETNRKEQEYNKAVSRLKKYKLEDGRPEQVIEPVLDEMENVIEEGYTIKGVEPVEPLMIDKLIYDDEGNQTGTEQVVNPIIQKDRDERAEAQLIVDKYKS